MGIFGETIVSQEKAENVCIVIFFSHFIQCTWVLEKIRYLSLLNLYRCLQKLSSNFYNCFIILDLLSYFIANIPNLFLNDALWVAEVVFLLLLRSVFLFSRNWNAGWVTSSHLTSVRILMIFKSLINLNVKLYSWLWRNNLPSSLRETSKERRSKHRRIYFSAAHIFILKAGRI